jgi:hypothetical protein
MRRIVLGMGAPEQSIRFFPEESDYSGAGLCLPKSPFLLRQLMLRAAMGTLLGHDVGAALTPPDAPNIDAF